ncbi:MAG: nickel-dependent hydrogenase large subunit [Archaeoglobaceae archaeon]
MVEYVKISPLTRLEGHLGITARINDVDGTPYATAAYAHGEMFRGFEKILIGRDPRDAPVITSRTCGVCHFVHRHTSLRAIENAAGWSFPAPQAYDGGTPGDTTNVRWIDGDRTMNYSLDAGGSDPLPLGGQLARNIVHGLTYVYSHAAHTIALAAPDYKKRIDEYVAANSGSLPGAIIGGETDGSSSFFDNFYNEAVVAQRILHEMLGFLGGKVPHQQSAIPGGFSRSFTGPLGTDTDMDAIAALAGKSIGHGGEDPSTATDVWPLLDLVDGLDAAKTLLSAGDWIAQRVTPFTLALAVGAHQEEATLWGRGSDNFVCAPTFDIVGASITGEAYFRGGAKIADGLAANGAGLYKLDNTVADAYDSTWVTVYEDIASGKYPEPSDITGRPVCGGYPGDTETHPLVGEAADKYAYTWYKATRVKDSDDKLFAVESGPFARLVVNDLDPDLNLGTSTDPYTIPGTSITLEGDGLRTDVYEDAAGDGSLGMASTTWNRLIGRLQDTLLCIDMIIGSNYSGEMESGKWLDEINTNGSWLTRLNSVISDNGGLIPGSALVQDTPPNGAWENLDGKAGAGYWDAPRGITCHFCKVDGGVLSQYQHIAGTTWNGNGRDAQGNPGPFEWSLMGMTKEEADVSFSEGSGGKWTASVTAPVCERTVLIKYELQEGTSGNWREYTAKDVPKHDGSEEGTIVGQGLKESSKIDYTSGDITLEFKYMSSSPDYDYMQNVIVDYYGTAANPVPTPVTWNDYKGHSDDTTKPNPINILRTIRSYDPCLACSVHVVDKEGREGKYEAVPVAGWDPK